MINWGIKGQEEILRRLNRPEGRVKVVIDTDTFNEVDDQFAVSYALLKPERFEILALHAAPFFNPNSSSAGDGMEKSYQELLHLLSLMGKDDLAPLVYRGSKNFLKDENTPESSPAASNLIRLANSLEEGEQLYVIAIGAITNVASALLMDPSIVNKIVVIWLGGNTLSWPTAKEFNLMQDVAADRIVFGSGVPLVQIPCMDVAFHLSTTKPELMACLNGKNPLCDYLCRITCEDTDRVYPDICWSRPIWDVSAVAWLACPEAVEDIVIPSPVITYDFMYETDENRHPIKYVTRLNRDLIFTDLFRTLTDNVNIRT